MRTLTKLGNIGHPAAVPGGRPPEMPLEKIVRDPSNPRPPLHLRSLEDQQKQRELDRNIQKRGVKSPISLRPHPTDPDKWIMNHGHCRYDGAVAAGLATIPYFIDPNFDSYDQIAENLHRADLSPWAIAEFIKRRLDDGESKGEIAEKLGKETHNFVTDHLALVDAPACLHQAYANGVTSARTLYDLRRAYDEFPEEVDGWCASGARVSRESIRELLEKLRHVVIRGPATHGPNPAFNGQDADAKHAEQEVLTNNDRGLDAPGPAQVPALNDDTTAKRPDVPCPAEPFQRSSFHGDETGVEAENHRSPRAAPLGSALHEEPWPTTKAPAMLQTRTLGRVPLQYKGRPVRIAPDATVKILAEDDSVSLEVPFHQLVIGEATDGTASSASQ
jgi:ParB family chromosome partitioning protein